MTYYNFLLYFVSCTLLAPIWYTFRLFIH